MSITKVGSSYNFIYNTKTGKLSTKDGSKNEFVDFCNGDVKGEDTETLNHFDEHTRYQFTRMLFAYGTGMTGQNPFANDEKVEITADIDSATHTSFYVNGQKAFTAITGMSYLPSEIQTFGTVQQPFKTRGYKPYDPSTNSITIGVGSRFNLGNGYSMTVQEDFVWGEDLDVLLELCDRIMVLCHGKITGICDAKKVTKEQVGMMMTGSTMEEVLGIG